MKKFARASTNKNLSWLEAQRQICSEMNAKNCIQNTQFISATLTVCKEKTIRKLEETELPVFENIGILKHFSLTLSKTHYFVSVLLCFLPLHLLLLCKIMFRVDRPWNDITVLEFLVLNTEVLILWNTIIHSNTFTYFQPL